MLHRLMCLLAHIALCLTVIQGGPVRAEQASAGQRGPAEVISDVTAQVMTVVAEANTYFDEDPDRYYRDIDEALAELVDWKGFATSAMATAAGKTAARPPKTWNPSADRPSLGHSTQLRHRSCAPPPNSENTWYR